MKRNDRRQRNLKCQVMALVLWLSVCAADSVIAEETTPAAPAAEESSWAKAGKEIGEAASAVGDASKEAWSATRETTAKAWDKTKETGSEVAESGEDVADATVETSKSIWQKTKETTSGWYNSGKKKIHELTAPEPEK